MAGTLFSLALSQRFDSQGKPLINAPLYIYDANTTTPVQVFQDFNLSILHQWPLRTDSAGMIPAFWLDDGNYRARFTDAAGAVVYFDIANMQAVGPSSGEGGEGGEGVDPNAIFQTGDELWVKRTGTRPGWVRQNFRTIGSASSGATERANADTQPLYEYLWNNFSDTLCPVVGGRGGSAASDFAANKAIATPDMRGYGPAGLDDMGNSAAGRIAGGTPTVPGSSGGAETRTLEVGHLPPHAHSFSATTSENGAHTHTYPNAGGSTGRGTGSASAADLSQGTTSAAGAHTHTVSGNTGNGPGSSTPINIMNPYRLGTWYIRL